MIERTVGSVTEKCLQKPFMDNLELKLSVGRNVKVEDRLQTAALLLCDEVINKQLPKLPHPGF
jgi:hypothetical protein